MYSFWFEPFSCFLIGRMFSLWGSHSSENAWHSDDLLAEVCWYHIAIFESWWASEKVGTLGDTKVETGSILSKWAGKSWRWRVWQSEWPNQHYVISTSTSRGKVWYGLIMFVPGFHMDVFEFTQSQMLICFLQTCWGCNLATSMIMSSKWWFGWLVYSVKSPRNNGHS